jgi:hypothetical protein
MGDISEGSGQWGSDVVRGAITPETVDAAVRNFSRYLSRGIAGETYPRLSTGQYGRIRSECPLPATEENTRRETARFLSAEESDRVKVKKLRPGAVKVSENSVFVLSDSFQWSPASAEAGTANRVSILLDISSSVRDIRRRMQSGGDVSLFQTETAGQLEAYKTLYQAYPKDDPLIRRFVRNFPAVSGVYEALITLTPLSSMRRIYTAGKKKRLTATARLSGLCSPSGKTCWTRQRKLSETGSPMTQAALSRK